MKTISLWQPWASLLFCFRPEIWDATADLADGPIGIAAKNFETRSWKTSYRGPLLIHAAKRFGADQRSACLSEPFRSVLRNWGGFTSLGDLPRGAIIGCVKLVAVYRAEKMRDVVPKQELTFGDFSSGRYAWRLETPYRFETPVPYRGSQGLFEVDETLFYEEIPDRHNPDDLFSTGPF